MARRQDRRSLPLLSRTDTGGVRDEPPRAIACRARARMFAGLTRAQHWHGVRRPRPIATRDAATERTCALVGSTVEHGDEPTTGECRRREAG